MTEQKNPTPSHQPLCSQNVPLKNKSSTALKPQACLKSSGRNNDISILIAHCWVAFFFPRLVWQVDDAERSDFSNENPCSRVSFWVANSADFYLCWGFFIAWTGIRALGHQDTFNVIIEMSYRRNRRECYSCPLVTSQTQEETSCLSVCVCVDVGGCYCFLNILVNHLPICVGLH